MNREIKLIIDLQFGSTGKGLIAGWLASRENPDTIVTAWAANAGHTYIDADGRKYVHTMLANGIVSKNLRRILMGPGSLINPEALQAEIESCGDLLKTVAIYIHPHAAVIQQKHVEEEAGPMTKIGSTKKGVGAAMIDRIRRNPDENNVAKNVLADHPFFGNMVCNSVEEYNMALDMGEKILVEGAQGYSLSLYHGLYPYCTSRDITPAQIFADCAIPIGWFKDTEVVGTLRTFPIRVANRFDEQGNQVGYSGGCYPDQQEITWADLFLEPELTTVTKLPRRIFTLSDAQLDEALRQCSVDSLFLNFANYCRSEKEFADTITRVTQAVIRNRVGNGLCWLGFGPNDEDVVPMSLDTSIEDLVEFWKRYAVVNQIPKAAA